MHSRIPIHAQPMWCWEVVSWQVPNKGSAWPAHWKDHDPWSDVEPMDLHTKMATSLSFENVNTELRLSSGERKDWPVAAPRPAVDDWASLVSESLAISWYPRAPLWPYKSSKCLCSGRNIINIYHFLGEMIWCPNPSQQHCSTAVGIDNSEPVFLDIACTPFENIQPATWQVKPRGNHRLRLNLPIESKLMVFKSSCSNLLEEPASYHKKVTTVIQHSPPKKIGFPNHSNSSAHEKRNI